tara:strand:- start:67 stop:579 length:513 start_codon:yes stop_codon:yes gene_type:complete
MIYDNVLNDSDYKKLEEDISSFNFNWCFRNSNIAYDVDNKPTGNDFLFTHVLFADDTVTSTFFPLMLPLVKFMGDTRQSKKLLRVKANLYVNQHTPVEYSEHRDQHKSTEKEVSVGVYSVNTNNGGTVVDGKRYKSEANRFLLFDNINHYGISQTDTQTRIIINFNFLNG